MTTRFIVPQYTKGQVSRAGEVVKDIAKIGSQEYDESLEILNNWRSAHAFPLNTFQMNLRRLAKKYDRKYMVAQRLKRTPSIVLKLQRFPKMELSRMQDLGGCRVIVSSVTNVYKIRDTYKGSRIKHVLANEKDYIEKPKESGYRGVHLVFKYRSDKKDTYNGLQIEVQMRTQVQHSWATAVETVGLFTQQSLKSSYGEEKWLRYFQLASSAFAAEEGFPLVPGTPHSRRAIRDELSQLQKELAVYDRLKKFKDATNIIRNDIPTGAHAIYLLRLDLKNDRLEISGFTSAQFDVAAKQYLALEKESIGDLSKDVVLVSVDSVENLTLAYPNYYMDTDAFVANVKEFVRGS
jgi:ppGpp synthetase/RelA/SpoT-type nucleotidyltranferase